jgi:ribonucleoside-diphosphate reductase subunit M2
MSIHKYINKISNLIREREGKVKRYALFPVVDEEMYAFYVKQEVSHWSENELDFVADKADYDAATPAERRLLNGIMAFFLVGDGVISENIVFRFLLEASTFEERAMFTSQAHIELIHAATYGLIATTLLRSNEQIEQLVETAESEPCVKAKVEFMEYWMYNDRPRWERLVAFACSEGVFFCSLFPGILCFRPSGKFANFVSANELIRSDETLHLEFGTFLALREINAHLHSLEQKLLNEQTDQTVIDTALKAELDRIQSIILQIVKSAVEVSHKFIDYILPEDIESLTNEGLRTFACIMGDTILMQLDCDPCYKLRNTLLFMDDASTEMKTNFYEKRVMNYTRQALPDILNWRRRVGLVERSTADYANPAVTDF